MKKSSKAGKTHTIISENPKMDTSGMAGKPMDFSDMVMEYKAPAMPLRQMVEKFTEPKVKK